MKLVLFLILSLTYSISCSDEEETIEQVKESKPDKPAYIKPTPKGDYHFLETFEVNNIGTRWIKSRAQKDDIEEAIAKYLGEWLIEEAKDSVLSGDKGLVLKSKAKLHAISAKLGKRFEFNNNKPLIVQYEVKFQNALECGGAYIKLISDDSNFKLENFFDKTGFTIMFGPDKCGTDIKLHFIVRFKNPVTGKYEEKHAKKSEILEALFSDGKTHMFTLILRPDNTFKMLIDSIEVNSGSLLKDLTPPINPEKEIIDPNDQKPENWDDREKIPDPDAVKPEDWDENEPKTIDDPSAQMPDGWLEDEPETIPDSSATIPEDWDEATDGEWEAPKVDNPVCKEASGCGKWSPPQISNPKYKGKWKAPLIENTNYQGKWEPRKIINPEYFEDHNPFKSLTPFSAIGLELWSMTDDIYFDNFLITDDEAVADLFSRDSWLIKKQLEYLTSSSSDSVIDRLLQATKEKPWLWAIYVLVILLPIVIISVFCFGKSGSPAKSSLSDSKKTDAQNEDDKESNEVDENGKEEEESAAENLSEDKNDLENAQEEKNNEDDEPSEEVRKSPTKRRPRKE